MKTIEQIENELPNGFHDAHLISIHIDYSKRKAVLDLDISTGDPDATDPEQRDSYQLGKLIINDLLFCVIDPPDPRYDYHDGPSRIDAGPLKSLTHPPKSPLPEPLPDNSFVHWFFVDQWNAFIYISGIDAEWRDS